MSTVSTNQSLLSKETKISKKMKSFLLFTIFFGLLIFSMSLFIKARIHSKHYGDSSIDSLAEDVKDLKKNQDKAKKNIERLFNNQQKILNEQSELRQIKDNLFEEITKVENIAVQTREAYNNAQFYLQQQDNTMKYLGKVVEMDKVNSQGGSQDKNYLMKELRNTQNELNNRLEAFKKILQNFELNLSNSNRKIAEDMKEIKTWVAQNSVSQEDLKAIVQSDPSTKTLLVNELGSQKNIVNQVAQNSLKQGNEIKEISKVLNNFKEYTLEALQQLGRQNTASEKRIDGVEKKKVSQGSIGKQSNETQQLAIDFKNFKEYTMEALKELRDFNNRKIKRINNIQSKKPENSNVSAGDIVSQEIEKFFNKLEDGKLLEKVLEETNISKKELHTFINIVKLFSEGNINGIMSILNQLAGGDLIEKVINTKEGLLKEFSPVINLLKNLSGENLKDIMKYASWINNLMGGNSEREVSKVKNNQEYQNAEKKKQYGLEDLFLLFE